MYSTEKKHLKVNRKVMILFIVFYTSAMFITEWSSSGIVQCDAAEHLRPLDQRTRDGPWGRVPTGLQRGESPMTSVMQKVDYPSKQKVMYKY